MDFIEKIVSDYKINIHDESSVKKKETFILIPCKFSLHIFSDFGF